MIIFFFMAGMLLALGAYLILLDVFRFPSRSTTKVLMGLERQMRTENPRIETLLEQIAGKLASLIHLREYHKAQIESDLRAIGSPLTPERYTANALVKAGQSGLFAIPTALLWWPASLIILLFSFLRYRSEMGQLQEQVKNRRESITYELPRFVADIEKVLHQNRNVEKMLEDYLPVAGPALKQELEITLADMRTGNHEEAVTRMEIRVGSPMMSEVCRGLISVLRGNDALVYFHMLQLKLSDRQRELLKDKATRIPKRVSKLSMALMLCFMGLWLVMMLGQVTQSMGTLFGS